MPSRMKRSTRSRGTDVTPPAYGSTAIQSALLLRQPWPTGRSPQTRGTHGASNPGGYVAHSHAHPRQARKKASKQRRCSWCTAKGRCTALSKSARRTCFLEALPRLLPRPHGHQARTRRRTPRGPRASRARRRVGRRLHGARLLHWSQRSVCASSSRLLHRGAVPQRLVHAARRRARSLLPSRLERKKRLRAEEACGACGGLSREPVIMTSYVNTSSPPFVTSFRHLLNNKLLSLLSFWCFLFPCLGFPPQHDRHPSPTQALPTAGLRPVLLFAYVPPCRFLPLGVGLRPALERSGARPVARLAQSSMAPCA